MSTLFDLKEFQTKNICKNCINLMTLQYDSGRKFYYCKVTSDNRTDNGMKKIKLNNCGCLKYVTR